MLEQQVAQDLGQWAEKSEVAATLADSPALDGISSALERPYGDN